MATQRPQVTLDDGVIDRLNRLAPLTAHLDFNGNLREAISRGLASMEAEFIGAETKRLVNQKLKQRQGSMAQALEVNKSLLGEEGEWGIEVDKSVLDAIATLEKGLSD